GVALACLGCPVFTRRLVPLGAGGSDVGASRTVRAAGVARVAAPAAVVRAAAAGAVRIAAPAAAVQAGHTTRGASPARARVVIFGRDVLSAASPHTAREHERIQRIRS